MKTNEISLDLKVMVRLRDDLYLFGVVVEIDNIFATVKLFQPIPYQDCFATHITTKLANITPIPQEELTSI